MTKLLAVEGVTPQQEAALLFAQGRFGQAAFLLEQAILDTPAQRDAWHLLFTLHRTQFEPKRFDALGERYRVQFNDAPPQWLDRFVLEALPEEMRPGSDAYVELARELADDAPERFEALHARCARHAVVHLDGSRIVAVDPASARRLSALLRTLASEGTGLFITGAARLAAILRSELIADSSQESYWTLLLDLYQLQDREQEFETAAMEFALHTGQRQPQWRASVLPVLHAHPVREKRAEPRYGGPEAIVLYDTIVEPHDEQLVHLERDAEERQYVNLDLARLLRVAPVAAQTLVRLVNGLAAAGKTVRLIRPNLLVEALLTTLSLDARVQLIRAQLP